jgi:hypothetical protein
MDRTYVVGNAIRGRAQCFLLLLLPKSWNRKTILIKMSQNRYFHLLWCGFRHLENTGENEYNFEFQLKSDTSPRGSLKAHVQYCFCTTCQRCQLDKSAYRPHFILQMMEQEQAWITRETQPGRAMLHAGGGKV